MKQFLILFTISLTTIFTGCYYDKYEEMHPSANACDTTSAISFSTHIVPILNSSCGTDNSCHSSSNTSGYDLTAYSGVSQVAYSGQLVSCVTWDGNASQMPQGSTTQISICAQTQIKKWVAAGYPNN